MREALNDRDPRGSTAHPAPDPGKFHTRRTCLFLDVDGTLADLAFTPDDVTIGSELIALLGRIHEQLEGALALVSGRPLAQLDRLFSPLRLPAAGIHGFERRSGSHVVYRPYPGRRLAGSQFAPDSESAAASRSGLLLEDKGAALALHYRAAPHARTGCRGPDGRRRRRSWDPDSKSSRATWSRRLKPATSTRRRRSKHS